MPDNKSLANVFEESDLYFKIGNHVPDDCVNLSYFETPSITKDDISIIDVFDAENITNFGTTEYRADKKTTLVHEENKNYIHTDNFILTNITNKKNNIDGVPLFYEHRLRYLHKSDGNIEEEIKIFDVTDNLISKQNIPYSLKVVKYNDTEYMVYARFPYLLSKEVYVKYNPSYNRQTQKNVDLPNDYTETIELEPIFHRVPFNKFNELANKQINTFKGITGDLAFPTNRTVINYDMDFSYGDIKNTNKIYSVYPTRGKQKSNQTATNYQIKVPHNGLNDDNFNQLSDDEKKEYNIDYNTMRPKVFDYSLYIEGYPEETQTGLNCYILYDQSSNINNYTEINNEIISFIQDLDMELDFTPLFNVLYYSYPDNYDSTHSYSDRIDHIFEWEMRSGDFFNSEELINRGMSNDGISGGINEEDIIDNNNNLYSSFNHALERMIGYNEDPEHYGKHSVIINITSNADNVSDEEDKENILEGISTDMAKRNTVEVYNILIDNNNIDGEIDDIIDELNNISETENHSYISNDISSTFNDIYNKIIDPKVYASVWPTDNDVLTRHKNNLPRSYDWIGNSQRTIQEDIPFSYYRLTDKKLKMDINANTSLKEAGIILNGEYISQENIDYNLPGDIDERDTLGIYAEGNNSEQINSRQYFIKDMSENEDIEIVMSEKDWTLDIKPIKFIKEKEVNDVYEGKKKMRYIYEVGDKNNNIIKNTIEASPNPYDQKSILLKNSPIISNYEFTNNNYITLKDINVTTLETDKELDNKIVDWDRKKGVIVFEDDINSSDIKVEYQYKDRVYYNYDGFNLIADSDKKFVPFNLKPQRGNIIGNLVPHGIDYMHGSALTDEVIYLYLRPSFVQEEINGEFVDIPNSYRESTVFHSIGTELNTLNYPIFDRRNNEKISLDEIILLGKIYIQSKSNKNNINYIDTRTRGGGIKEEEIEKLKEIHPEINYYWDIGNWDGKPYPSNSTIVIEIPEEVKEYLTEDQIEEKINKHLALGVLPIIKYI